MYFVCRTAVCQAEYIETFKNLEFFANKALENLNVSRDQILYFQFGSPRSWQYLVKMAFIKVRLPSVLFQTIDRPRSRRSFCDGYSSIFVATLFVHRPDMPNRPRTT